MGWLYPSEPKPRKNWKKELKAERNKVLDEAIQGIKDDRRLKPLAWHRGYNSAITKLESMKV